MNWNIIKKEHKDPAVATVYNTQFSTDMIKLLYTSTRFTTMP